MRRLYILILVLFSVPQAWATNPLVEVSYTLLGATRENNRIVLALEDPTGTYVFHKPAMGYGYSLALWKDVTPGMAMGVRYSRGRHLPRSGMDFFFFSGLVTPRMNYHLTESWRLGSRFYRPQSMPRKVYPFLSAGVGYTRTGWNVKNGLLGPHFSKEELEKGYAKVAQWEVDVGAGLFFYRGKRTRLAFEITIGAPVIYNDDPYLNSQMNLILGF